MLDDLKIINVQLNGESVRLAETQANLLSALESFGYAENFFAVAINNQFIPKSAYAETFLKENDQIEIVVPMQGG